MSGDRHFWTYDASFLVAAGTDRRERLKGHELGWNEPDWETFNRLKDVLTEKGFSFELDPGVLKRYRCIAKYHHLGRCGDLFVHAETYPTGCKFEFFQEIVTENRNGGRYDFGKVGKMPYLIRKRFDGCIAALRAHLIGRGFICTDDIPSPIVLVPIAHRLRVTEGRAALPTPRDISDSALPWFNGRWDSEYERKRGVHRFERDHTGWPSRREVYCWEGRDRDGREIFHGELRYFRDAKGYLRRGRVFGGINGMWTVIYGPGLRDWTSVSCGEIFTCSPAEVPRKRHQRRASAIQVRLRTLRADMVAAAAAEKFERAAKIRDAIQNLQRFKVAA